MQKALVRAQPWGVPCRCREGGIPAKALGVAGDAPGCSLSPGCLCHCSRLLATALALPFGARGICLAPLLCKPSPFWGRNCSSLPSAGSVRGKLAAGSSGTVLIEEAILFAIRLGVGQGVLTMRIIIGA